jgi:hypothetical protein
VTDPISDTFAGLFATACKTLNCKEVSDPGTFRLAQDAVAESVALYERRCFFAPALQGLFAEHYREHTLGLATQFTDTFIKFDISEVSALRDLRCLVLLFCSFAWHDAGMAKLPKSADVGADNIQFILRHASVRAQHQERSLEVLDST